MESGRSLAKALISQDARGSSYFKVGCLTLLQVFMFINDFLVYISFFFLLFAINYARYAMRLLVSL